MVRKLTSPVVSQVAESDPTIRTPTLGTTGGDVEGNILLVHRSTRGSTVNKSQLTALLNCLTGILSVLVFICEQAQILR